ncbi:MAG: SPOR domain-containing protein [Granulosicoccus sp.]
MASATSETANTRLFVLALGLLVGFVVGFVVLLSNLPVDRALSDYRASEVDAQADNTRDYDFYTELPREHLTEMVEDVTSAPKVVRPATRVVPGNAQTLSSRNLAAEGYAEIPASSLGQESYYLQAGNFIKPNQAERARAAVLLLGLEAFIVTRQDSVGATGHRVRIGPFFDQERLTNAKKRLRDGNIPYEIIRVTG